MVFEMNNSFSREFAQQDVYHCLTYIMGAIDGFGRGMLDSLFEVKQQYVKQCQSCKSTLETLTHSSRFVELYTELGKSRLHLSEEI